MKFQWMLVFVFFATVAAAQMNMPSGDGFMNDMNVSMKKMDQGMSSAPMNGKADHDFVTMMIPHHQGAIDMAQGELKYGKDLAMRALAGRIIKDQQAEIEFMNRWLKENK